VTPRLVVEPAAELDLIEAYAWYEEQRGGLGDEFLDEVQVVFGAVEDAPQQFHVERGDVRKALVRRFPYLVFFVEAEEAISVLAVFHARRDPTIWHLRADV
jgi:plasmid stabilization system protein ParE